MRLTDLEPRFVKWLGPGERGSCQYVDSIAEADGIFFLCPLCFLVNGGPIGTHGIKCWEPNVPLDVPPGPGRWNLTGSGYHDLSLVAGSSSIALRGGCAWHGYVQNGEVHTGLEPEKVEAERRRIAAWRANRGGTMPDETQAAPPAEAPVVDEWAGYQPTARLRFVKRDELRILQQRWDHHEGAQRWRDVPLED